MVLKERIDALLTGAAAAGGVPGVVAALTHREGTIYEGGALSADSVAWIASMTKPLAAAAAGPRQYLFLDRSRARTRWRILHADPPLRR
jgi:hypothetical protein